LLKLLTDPTITLIVVEHKDRLTRFGFNYIEQLLAMQGRQVEVVNLADASSALSAGNGKKDLIQDFVTLRSRHFFLRPAVRPTSLEA
jgi:predicted site-specific integrase-resolvase